ncbi:MAG: YajQ family cyclic di-GMP-binding protein [Candidatus Omnitrophica bacterium]|nr:YajQ family cyclic di-GMP-binding protein [Candidatus Omnitrophota bacterium]
MSKEHSFDIVSTVDFQEVTNAVDQAKKEVSQRYDFRGSSTELTWNVQEQKIVISTENDVRLRATVDILETKLSKRGVSLKSLTYGKVEKASGNSLRQHVEVINGLSSEKSKEIVKFIKQLKSKVQAQIQKEQIRVTSAKIDSLQEAISALKNQDFGVDLKFENYR